MELMHFFLGAFVGMFPMSFIYTSDVEKPTLWFVLGCVIFGLIMTCILNN